MRFGIFFLLVGCAAGPASSREEFREQRLRTVPEDARLNGLVAFSEDGSRVAYVEREGDACRAVCGPWKSRPFKLVC